MSHAAIKSLIITTVLIAISSCGNSDKQRAQSLLDQAKAQLEVENYQQALILADSIKTAYPHEVDIRREALHVRTRAFEGVTLRQLQEADSIVAVLSVKVDSLTASLKWINNPIEGYYLSAGSKPEDIGKTTCIQARMSPDGMFYLISSLSGANIKSTSVGLNSGTDEVYTTTVPHDGERNDRSMGAEVITFIGSECDTIGAFAHSHLNEPISMTFVGDKGRKSLPLKQENASQIASVWEAATAIRALKTASIEKERLNRTLETARAQAARTFVTSPED